MPDREKVIKGLEICSHPGGCRSECPYYEKEGAECSYWLLKDALELLNEQEPRVLTFEEVQNDCPDYVYLETSTGWLGYCIKDEGESDKYVGYLVFGVDEYFIERWKEYGKTWRCWTAMPTDKQRKAVNLDG